MPKQNLHALDPDEVIGWREKSSRMCWRDRGSFALSSYELRASRDWTRNLIELYKMEDDQICILIVTFMSYIKKNRHDGVSFAQAISQQSTTRKNVQLLLHLFCKNNCNIQRTRQSIWDLHAIYVRDKIAVKGIGYLFPKINRTLATLSHQFANDFLGFTLKQLYKLRDHLRLPEKVKVCSNVFSGEEMMIIGLMKLISSPPIKVMAQKGILGGNRDLLNGCTEEFVDHLYETFFHKFTGSSMKMWTDKKSVRKFRRMIYDKCKCSTHEIEALLDNRIENVKYLSMLFEEFLSFGFIDDTGVTTCRPGSGPESDEYGAPRKLRCLQIQQAFYSGYCKKHGIKFQVVVLPNGMIGCIFRGSLRHNDIGMLNKSGLIELLIELLDYVHPELEILPGLFGDSIYKACQVIFSRIEEPDTEEKEAYNARMNSLRQCIELLFGLLVNKFKILSDKRQFKLLNEGERAIRTASVCFFLLNCWTCFNGNQVNTIFDSEAPTIEEYLPLNEVLPVFEALNL